MRDGACGTTECLHRRELAQRTPEEKAEAKRSALRCEEVSAAFRRLLSAQRGTPEKKAARLAFDDLMARRLATAEDSSDAKTRPRSESKTTRPAAATDPLYEYLGRVADAPHGLTSRPINWTWAEWNRYEDNESQRAHQAERDLRSEQALASLKRMETMAHGGDAA